MQMHCPVASALLTALLGAQNCFVGVAVRQSEQPECQVPEESDRHNRIEQAGSQTEDPGSVLVRLDAQPPQELQTDADASPAIGMALTDQQSKPVVTGDRKLLDHELLDCSRQPEFAEQ